MTTALDTLPKIGAPATRSLQAAGYGTLARLAGASREALLDLHGVGPKAVRIIEAELQQHGLALT